MSLRGHEVGGASRPAPRAPHCPLTTGAPRSRGSRQPGALLPGPGRVGHSAFGKLLGGRLQERAEGPWGKLPPCACASKSVLHEPTRPRNRPSPGAHGVSRPWRVTPQTHPRAAECLCPRARPTKHVCRTEWGRPLFRKAQAGKRSGPLRASGLCREDSALPHEVATGDVHTSGPGHVPTSLTRGHGNLKK